MSESVEKQARKALRRMVFWRIVGELARVPQAILGSLQVFFTALNQWVNSIEVALFYFELDAARRYKLLTGVDPGIATGAPGRYGLANHPDLADDLQRQYFTPREGDES